MQEVTQKRSSKFATYQLFITEARYFYASKKVFVKQKTLKIYLFNLTG